MAHTWRFCARTVVMLVIPRTKHIASRILDFPLPFSPVIELKLSSLYPYQYLQSWKESRHCLPSRDDGSHSVRFKTLSSLAFLPCNTVQDSHTSIMTSTTLILAIWRRGIAGVALSKLFNVLQNPPNVAKSRATRSQQTKRDSGTHNFQGPPRARHPCIISCLGSALSSPDLLVRQCGHGSASSNATTSYPVSEVMLFAYIL